MAPQQSGLVFSKESLNSISSWKYHVEDKTISTQYLTPFWNNCLQYIPEKIAPNVITLAGFMCIIYALYLVENYNHWLLNLPICFLIFCYSTLDALDGKQARRIKNSSPMGELFDHATDVVVSILIGRISMIIFSIDESYHDFYYLAGGTMFAFSHFQAMLNGAVTFHRFDGPNELMFALCMGFLLQMIVNLSFIFNNVFVVITVGIFPLAIGVAVITQLLTQPNVHKSATVMIKICILIFFMVGYKYLTTIHYFQYVCFFGIITIELIVAKMSKSHFRDYIFFISIVGFIMGKWISLAMFGHYAYSVFEQISTHMKLPMFKTYKNVYCCGVFDLFHHGHQRMMASSLKFGDRLFVGVHSSADVETYKRAPVMTMEERIESVSNCKYTCEIVPSAPLITNQAILDKYQIHVVVLSKEYDKPDDLYYALPRSLKMAKVLPRTDSISTTDLINRCKLVVN
jgi:cytidyltransferase-like protein